MRAPIFIAFVALLAGCPAHEGPIDVLLDGIPAEDATIEWAGEGEAFQLCSNGTTFPDAVVGCGPYGAGDPGDYTVRVIWHNITRDQEVTLERDGSYEANVAITFSADDFPPLD